MSMAIGVGRVRMIGVLLPLFFVFHFPTLGRAADGAKPNPAPAASAASTAAPKPPARPAIDPEKPAETQFKNIQVLKGVPAGKIGASMESISMSLGVECNFCHVRGGFEKDDKPEKATARKMIQMVQNANRETFGGKLSVTCASCHLGKTKPASVAPFESAKRSPLDPEIVPSAADSPLPAPESIFARYVEALGGKEAIAKVSTRRIVADDEQGDGEKSSVEIFKKAPGAMIGVSKSVHDGQESSWTIATDGTNAWAKFGPGEVRDMLGFRKAPVMRDAQFFPAVESGWAYSSKTVLGTAKLGDREAVVVSATAPDGVREKLFFDRESGLLVRRNFEVGTPLGAIPFLVSYSDYRKIDGVKIAFVVESRQPGERDTETVREVKHGVAVDDSQFRKPAPAN